MPDTTTRMIRELIITKGDDEGKEEDFAYDPAEIKKGFNARKAEIEQLKKSNEFKHELIRAYEDYYDADGDSTSYSKWQVIDSLYRSQI